MCSSDRLTWNGRPWGGDGPHATAPINTPGRRAIKHHRVTNDSIVCTLPLDPFASYTTILKNWLGLQPVLMLPFLPRFMWALHAWRANSARLSRCDRHSPFLIEDQHSGITSRINPHGGAFSWGGGPPCHVTRGRTSCMYCALVRRRAARFLNTVASQA